MSNSLTEMLLATWRNGPTSAERMTADLLRLENYHDVEPQAPLGGPDGRADVLCRRDGYSYVAAVYFPPTPQEFRSIADKFQHDLEGVLRRARNAFAFFTNQRLSRGERDNLKAIAKAKGLVCEIYDVERIRGILDTPMGYGYRARYLTIQLDAAEQVAFYASRESAMGAQPRSAEVNSADTVEIRRRSDIHNAELALSKIDLEILQRHIDDLPLSVEIDVLDFFYDYQDVVGSFLFYINDPELGSAFHGLATAWQQALAPWYNYHSGDGRRAFFSSPGDAPLSPERQEDWDSIVRSCREMVSYISKLTDIVRRNYPEINLRETSRRARENWLRERAILEKKFFGPN